MHPTVGASLATIILDERRAEAEAERLAATLTRSRNVKAALQDGLAAIRTAFSYPVDRTIPSPGLVIPQLRDYPYAW
jgi:hypothetical protein